MISIACDGVSLSFGADLLFDNVTFALNEGDKLGIVGANGAGKSTLFKILTGVMTPDTGSVYISRDKTVGYLAQHNSLDSQKPILEEMLSAFPELLASEAKLEKLHALAEAGDEEAALAYAEENEYFIEHKGLEFRSRCRGILINLGFSEAYFDSPISSLSGGQKERLALARILIQDPDIILLDEPNNHLDIANIEWLEKYLSISKKTVLVISHDRYFLSAVTNKTLDISHKKARLYNGGYDRFVEQKKKDEETLEKLYKTQQKEIARLEEVIEQQKRWNREKNIIKAEATQKRIDRMEKVDAPAPKEGTIRMKFREAEVSGNDVLSIRHMTKSYPAKTLFRDFSYEVKRGDRVMITGPNGCGKSTLLKILTGRVFPEKGVFDYGYNVVKGYYDQENQILNPENTVIDELWNEYPDMTQTEIRNSLALFLFRGDDILKKISLLSGGEKARLSLAKIILSKINLLILDEPTNHLDIASMEVLEEALSDFDGTIIAVSHDRYFMKKLSTRMLAFRGEEIFAYEGNYDQYISYRDRYLSEGGEDHSGEEKKSKEEYLKSKQNASEKRKKERHIETLKKEASDAENELDALSKEAEGEASTDHVRLAEIYERTEYLEERLLEIWSELENESTI